MQWSRRVAATRPGGDKRALSRQPFDNPCDRRYAAADADFDPAPDGPPNGDVSPATDRAATHPDPVPHDDGHTGSDCVTVADANGNCGGNCGGNCDSRACIDAGPAAARDPDGAAGTHIRSDPRSDADSRSAARSEPPARSGGHAHADGRAHRDAHRGANGDGYPASHSDRHRFTDTNPDGDARPQGEPSAQLRRR